MVGDCTEPFGRVPVTGHSVIVDTSGVLDAVMRSLAQDYLATEKEEEPPSWLQMLLLTKDLSGPQIYEDAEAAELDSELVEFLEKLE